MLVRSDVANINPSSRDVLQRFPWKEFLVLVLLGLAGVVAALPSAREILDKTASTAKIPVEFLAAGQILQSAFWISITVGVGLVLGTRTGLGAPILKAYLAGEPVASKFRALVLPSTSLALLATVLVAAADRLFFLPQMPGFSSAISQVSGWKGILASFYGGITEEILTRLFFVTFLAWILSWFSHSDGKKPSNLAMWIAIVSSAVIFGLGHLPATLASTPFSMIVLTREVLLNGIYGTTFGYLYWKRGLESSILSHFTSDLLVHVILPIRL